MGGVASTFVVVLVWVMAQSRFEERSVPKGFNHDLCGMFPTGAVFYL